MISRCNCQICRLSAKMEEKYEGEFLDYYHGLGMDLEYNLIVANEDWRRHFNIEHVAKIYQEWKKGIRI